MNHALADRLKVEVQADAEHKEHGGKGGDLFDTGFGLDQTKRVRADEGSSEQVAGDDLELEALERPGEDGGAEDEPEEHEAQRL